MVWFLGEGLVDERVTERGREGDGEATKHKQWLREGRNDGHADRACRDARGP